MSALAILLTVIGGLLELAGIGLVAVEIRADRALAEAYLKRVEEAPSPGFQGSPIRAEIRMMEDYDLRRGTAEEQVGKLRDKSEKDTKRIAEAATRATYEERARFQGFVRDLLQGGLGQRKWGAVLVSSGIVVSVAANVVSAAS